MEERPQFGDAAEEAVITVAVQFDMDLEISFMDVECSDCVC